MVGNFISLEYKRFFRSSYWQKSLALNIFMAFLGLYLMLNFVIVGFGLFFLLKKHFPEKDPWVLVNSYLFFWWGIDMLWRYFNQKLPEAAVKPFLTLSLRKKQIAHYILFKSTFSFWNVLPIMFFVPFAAVLWSKGYDHTQILLWVGTALGLVLVNNYMNYLVNNSDKFLWLLGSLLIGIFGLDYFNKVPFHKYFYQLFDTRAHLLVSLAVIWLFVFLFYRLAYKNIYSHLYLDDKLKGKQKAVHTSDLSFTSRFGEVGTYLNNDIKLIWRNKRTKNMVYGLLFMPLMGLMYIFRDYKDAESMIIQFFVPAVYMVGLVSISFGLNIPAWDSAYYPLLMSQKVNLRKYIEAKWLFLSMVNIIGFILSIPYAFKDIRLLLLLFTSLMLNLGVINFVVLWNSSNNSKRIDLDQKATFNTQGFSIRNLVMSMIVYFVPFILMIVGMKTIGFGYTMFIVSSLALVSLFFKNTYLDKITALYQKKKYKTLQGFKQD